MKALYCLLFLFFSGLIPQGLGGVTPTSKAPMQSQQPFFKPQILSSIPVSHQMQATSQPSTMSIGNFGGGFQLSLPRIMMPVTKGDRRFKPTVPNAATSGGLIQNVCTQVSFFYTKDKWLVSSHFWNLDHCYINQYSTIWGFGSGKWPYMTLGHSSCIYHNPCAF